MQESAQEDRRAYPSSTADHQSICRTSRGRSAAFRATGPGRASRVLGVEGPDVEVLDTVASVHMLQGSALAKGPAQEATGMPARTVRIPLEQLRLSIGRQRGQSKQVGYFDPRQRLICIFRYPAIPSRLAPIYLMPQQTGCGMRTCSAGRRRKACYLVVTCRSGLVHTVSRFPGEQTVRIVKPFSPSTCIRSTHWRLTDLYEWPYRKDC
jgi:hypothetical protein